MRKTWFFPLVFLVLAAALSVGTARAAAVDVEVDGEVLPGGETVDGVTYVPLRGLLERLGDWELSWDGENETAEASSELMTLTFPLGEPWLLIDGLAVDSPPAYLREGRTYVPLRSVARLCGAHVRWQGRQSPVEVTSGYAECREEDLFWLSRIISAESQGESYLGQLAVGAVVLNRVESGDYPDTIYDVVFEYNYAYQFEPVANGAIHWEPTEKSVLAAKACLNGARVLKDSLYFFAPALSEGAWITANRTYAATIGCHRFYV